MTCFILKNGRDIQIKEKDFEIVQKYRDWCSQKGHTNFDCLELRCADGITVFINLADISAIQVEEGVIAA